MMIMLLISSNSNLSFSQSNPDNSLTFEDPVLGVKFEYTDEWVRQGSFLYGADSECSSLPCMRLPEISISISPTVFEGFSLENYTQQQSFYHNLSEGYKPIALNETKIGENDAFQYVYSTISPFLTENDEIINHEIYTTEGINLYKISFTAIQDEYLNKYLNSFKKIIDTFTITK
jgi:hypothetical protein